MYGSGFAAGNVAATKLKHLKAQAMDSLQSSGGQHGVSARSAIDISAGFVEIAAPPVAGIMATEMAIRAARIVRTVSIGSNYQAILMAGQQRCGWVTRDVTRL